MNETEAVSIRKLSPFSIAIVVVAAAVAVTFLLAPEATKPLFLKYYRAMYSTEVVRGS